MSIVLNTYIFGSINLDWTIQWKDKLNNNINGAYFDSSGNTPGTFTYYTKPINASGGGTLQPEYYQGTLASGNIYDYIGNQVITYSNSQVAFPPQITYITSQYGMQYFDASNNYVYPNVDFFSISTFWLYNSSGAAYRIDDFNVTIPIYDTTYINNFEYNLTKSLGCRLPKNYITSFPYTYTLSGNTYTYQLYYGAGNTIPTTLQTQFNISSTEALNIFTNKYSNAIQNFNPITKYWQYFSNNYGKNF